ncbi:hypothetical protein RclHR1_01470010 [Rhizophagus clarus]|uniref:Hemocyanin II n=1 Tax=Rhizophagus clarus TaxID=94130 RepID=A0A2Z6QHN6_9GLOM|nr:hypothetical protein RclHR1_01470010 [Rhizophagus clarus]GES84218.1 hemocyanin II [Rhizophagus clarus]
MAAGPEDIDIELFMNWFREDPNLNKHYECWNLVCNQSGFDSKSLKRVYRDRNGEMFVYMYRQMLARYDAERLGLNLPLTRPLDNYRAPIEEGYEPNGSLVTIFGSRKANSVLDNTTVQEIEKYRVSIKQAIEMGKFHDGTEIDINLLGAVVSGANMRNYYGGLHARGHVAIASISNKPGVMSATRVASRDPVFWRWHRHIDNLINLWEEKQEPNDFSNSPPVKLRDVILAFKNELPIGHEETEEEEAAAFGEKTFGGGNFDKDVSNNEYVTNELQTRMKSKFWTYFGLTENIDYLFPREFYYFFRVENTSSSPFDVTFRVFLVPEELAESRRHWIELDKFKGGTIPPNSKTVVCRSSDMSSVVRQPPRKTRNELDVAHGTTRNPLEAFYDCGWPYHLLLPRGRRGGMKFKLLVFISDWSQDKVPRKSRFGSISFGGNESLYSKYPDNKPMGYPLDRPFKNNSYQETFAGLNNAIIRDVSIKWVDEWQEVFDDD